MWAAGWGDEELTYKLERCIYTFFMSGLSVFDSFTYCPLFSRARRSALGLPEGHEAARHYPEDDERNLRRHLSEGTHHETSGGVVGGCKIQRH